MDRILINNNENSTEEMIRYDRRGTDQLQINIEKCLEEIKKDLRVLPCKSDGTDCTQEKAIEELRESRKEAKQAYEICHTEKLEPLIRANLMLNEKQDKQQVLLERIEKKIDQAQVDLHETKLENTKELAALRLDLVKQLTTVIVQKDTKQEIKLNTKNWIKWGLYVIISLATITTIITGIVKFIFQIGV